MQNEPNEQSLERLSQNMKSAPLTDEERETYKRALNLKLIDKMIREIPAESKYCVSYGQLQGCYWTIPATSTQGTTKEGDKDYIARVALSANMDLDRHKQVFLDFVRSIWGLNWWRLCGRVENLIQALNYNYDQMQRFDIDDFLGHWIDGMQQNNHSNAANGQA